MREAPTLLPHLPATWTNIWWVARLCRKRKPRLGVKIPDDISRNPQVSD
jgi:hypothetical protein